MRYVLLAFVLTVGMGSAPAQSQQGVPDLPAAPSPAAKPIFVVPKTVVGPSGELDSERLGPPPETPEEKRDCVAPSDSGWTVKDKLSTERKRDVSDYVRAVQMRIYADWVQHMPFAAKDPWLKGADLLVKFSVRKDGQLQDLTVMMKSGRESYDSSATRAIRESAPFPLPSGVEGPITFCTLCRYNPKQQDALPKDPFAPKPVKP